MLDIPTAKLLLSTLPVNGEFVVIFLLNRQLAGIHHRSFFLIFLFVLIVHNFLFSSDYAGTLIDGTEFDSSYKRGQPLTFAPNQVIK